MVERKSTMREMNRKKMGREKFDTKNWREWKRVDERE